MRWLIQQANSRPCFSLFKLRHLRRVSYQVPALLEQCVCSHKPSSSCRLVSCKDTPGLWKGQVHSFVVRQCLVTVRDYVSELLFL